MLFSANCEDTITTKILPPEEKPLSQQEHHYGSGYKHTGNEEVENKDYYEENKRDTTTYHVSSGNTFIIRNWTITASLVFILIAVYQRWKLPGF